jgi:dTDP-4-dehydrorhamnose reductase
MTAAWELVVGADGRIGGGLLRELRSLGRPALGTTRRRDGARTGHVLLDLARPADGWELPEASVAYLCAAMTGLEACRRDPVRSALVNVEATVRLAERLARRGAFVIFLSSNQVFDGTRPQRRPEESSCPTTAYGRQKAEAERRILELGPRAAVVRLTKLLGPNDSLLTGWVASLLRGEEVRPFSDLRMAPVPLGYAVAVLREVGRRRRAGLLQVSGNRDVTYAEAALLGTGVLGVAERLVRPLPSPASALGGEPPPRHTTLATDGLWEACGVEVPEVESTIENVFLQAGSLVGTNRDVRRWP